MLAGEDVKSVVYVEQMNVYKFLEVLSYRIAVINSQND